MCRVSLAPTLTKRMQGGMKAWARRRTAALCDEGHKPMSDKEGWTIRGRYGKEAKGSLLSQDCDRGVLRYL